MTLGFRYFRGREADMSGLLPGLRVCSLCGELGQSFDLERTIVTGLSEAEREGKVGCLECLRQDRFGFFHVTEVGFFDDEGLTPLHEPDDFPERVFVVSEDGGVIPDHAPVVPLPKPRVSEEAIAELRRTPNFPTYQDIEWLVHHDDFMAYLGIWGPKELAAISPGDNGRSLFFEVVDPASYSEMFWPEGEDPLFADNLVAFQCLHCQAYRGILDFD